MKKYTKYIIGFVLTVGTTIAFAEYVLPGDLQKAENKWRRQNQTLLLVQETELEDFCNLGDEKVKHGVEFKTQDGYNRYIENCEPIKPRSPEFSKMRASR